MEKTRIRILEAVKTRALNLKLYVELYDEPNKIQFFSEINAITTFFIQGIDITPSFKTKIGKIKLNNPLLNSTGELSSETTIELKIEPEIKEFFEILSEKCGYDINELNTDFTDKASVTYVCEDFECEVLFEQIKKEEDRRQELYNSIYALYREILPFIRRVKPEIDTAEDVDTYFKNLFKVDRKRDLKAEVLERYRNSVLKYIDTIKKTSGDI